MFDKEFDAIAAKLQTLHSLEMDLAARKREDLERETAAFGRLRVLVSQCRTNSFACGAGLRLSPDGWILDGKPATDEQVAANCRFADVVAELAQCLDILCEQVRTEMFMSYHL